MINLAVFHGFNGLRQVLDEYVTRPGRRVITHTLIWTFAAALMVAGSYAILMFQPDQAYIQKWKSDRTGQTITAREPAPRNHSR
jgi:succinate dehydrogenase / fumarate reductase membrane anchor subunit